MIQPIVFMLNSHITYQLHCYTFIPHIYVIRSVVSMYDSLYIAGTGGYKFNGCKVRSEAKTNFMPTNFIPIAGGYKVGGHKVGGHKVGEHKVGGHKVGGHKVGGHKVGGHKVSGHKVGGHKVR